MQHYKQVRVRVRDHHYKLYHQSKTSKVKALLGDKRTWWLDDLTKFHIITLIL